MDALQFGPHGCFRGEHLRGVAPNGKAGFRIAGCWLPLLARPSGQGLLALASPPSEVTHSQVYWLVLPEEARATGVIQC